MYKSYQIVFLRTLSLCTIITSKVSHLDHTNLLLDYYTIYLPKKIQLSLLTSLLSCNKQSQLSINTPHTIINSGITVFALPYVSTSYLQLTNLCYTHVAINFLKSNPHHYLHFKAIIGISSQQDTRTKISAYPCRYLLVAYRIETSKSLNIPQQHSYRRSTKQNYYPLNITVAVRTPDMSYLYISFINRQYLRIGQKTTFGRLVVQDG